MEKTSREERKNAVIKVLNQARSMELTAIHQYMNQHYTLADKDFGELAMNIKLIAIDEMRHAESFAERVKELGGEPTTELAAGVEKNQSVETVFGFDSDQEDEAIEVYNQALKTCMDNGDVVSAKLFESIIQDEQEHYNYFDSIKSHLDTLGNVYLAKIAGTSSSTGAVSKGFVSGTSEE